MTEDIFFRNFDYIESFKMPFCILNNTLLSIYRDGKIFNQDNRENIFLMAAPYRFYMRNASRVKSEIFGITGLGNINLHEFIGILFWTQFKDKLIINPFEDRFHVIPQDMIFPLRTITFRERPIPAPNKIEDFLAYYYGDWKTPIPPEKWDWYHNSKTVITAKNMEEAYEKSL